MDVRQKPGRFYRQSAVLDSQRGYVTDDMGPEELVALLKSADDGDISAVMDLSEEMEAKDSRIQQSVATRRQGVTSLGWHLEPDTTDPDRKAEALEAVEFCESELRGMSSWESTLKHLGTSVGPGLAVSEKVLARGRIVRTVDVRGDRLIGDNAGGPGVFVITEEQQSQGIRIDPVKFATWTPHIRAGDPFRVTPMRSAGYLYVIKRFALADHSAFAEKFGFPFVLAWVDASADEEEVKRVHGMLRELKIDSTGVFRKNTDGQLTEIELKEAARESEPFSALRDYCDKEISVAFLGQTLTTEAGSVGSLALGRVHENIRAGILSADIEYEATAIREQFLRQMVWMRWPRQDFPVPFWRREVVEQRDLDAERMDHERLTKAREEKLPVDDAVKYEKLGLPVPTGKPTDDPGNGG